MPETFTLTRIVAEQFRTGYGVSVLCIYSDDADSIAEIEVGIARIAEDTVHSVGSAWCVESDDGLMVPVSCFRDVSDLTCDDTHDLRDRWFATREEAAAHADAVRSLWAHPNPWTAFVEVG